MPRHIRHDPPGGVHHVVNRGVDRCDVFVDDEARTDFGDGISVVAERFGVRIIAYCLMTNHFHLVVRCPEGGLSESMRYLSGVFTRHLNDRLGRDGPLFRGRFTSRSILTPEYERNAVRYVHRNALDLPGVSGVDQYRWSSHRAYLGHKRRPPWLECDRVLEQFDDADAFHRFVAADLSTATPVDIDAHRLLDALRFLIAARSPDDARVRPGDIRAAALHLAERHPGVVADRIGEALEFPNDAARRNAVSRSRRRLDEQPDLVVLAAHALGLVARPLARRAA